MNSFLCAEILRVSVLSQPIRQRIRRRTVTLYFNLHVGHGQEPPMGSRGQHPGCSMENNFARASSTLGEVGEAAQRVSRCQHRQCQEGPEEGDEVQGCIQVSESCARPATNPSISSGDARGSSSQGPTVASRTQCVGRCRCG